MIKVADSKSPVWMLRMQHSDYAIGVDAAGKLQHLYWGAKLVDEQDLPGADDRPIWILEDDQGYSRQEIMPWGGLNYDEPGLKVTFADGIRDLVLVYHSYEQPAEDELVLVLKDALKPLTVRLVYKVRAAVDIVERHVELHNEGTEDIRLEQVLSAIWHLPIQPQYRMSYLSGLWAGETQIQTEPLKPGKKVIESRRGTGSHQMNPFFFLDFGLSDEEFGEVYFGAVAYSGSWKIVAEQTTYQSLLIGAGINDFDFSWKLEPGETFTTPISIGGYSGSGYGEASRKLHRYQLQSVLPCADQLRPVLYNSWEATKFDVNEQQQMRLAEKAAKLGCELFVMDDGWFGERHSDQAGLGDWTVNRTKFPNGLQPLIQHVKSLGMQFGIWLEPEMVNPDSDLFRSHPEWIYHFPGRDRTLSRNQCVLNVAREDVQEHLFGVMHALLSENDISFIKWDMNRYFTEPGWPNAPAGREQELWVRHTRGIYSILDRLQQQHPNVAFEACSGGGGRVDLGMMKYVVQFWTSDNTDPYDRLRIQEGYSLAYNIKSMMCWVTDAPNYINQRSAPLKYRFHSSMMGSLGIGMNLNELSEEELEQSRQYIEQYKRIRRTIQEGSLYRIASPRASDDTAVQYVSGDQSESVVFALRRSEQFRMPFYPIRLRGLDPDAAYSIEGSDVRRSGRSFMSRGIQVQLEADFTSELIVLRKV
ncbi:alpha-galactosidase [Paenibacillus sp. GCM10023252]|uniref:alpha-galactosidase n=1 Tax=Paenibacillus sp. GCM10023252 TaxID=3252649 RepID=UPI00360E6CFA